MDDSSALPPPSPMTPSTLRRWQSIPTTVVVPTELSLPPHRAPSHGTTTATASSNTHALLDLELDSIKSPFLSYTSLKDVLPSPTAAVNSPTASSSSAYHISIRNRLVKQAAWAYLQPMSASPSSPSAPNFLRRLCHRFSSFLRFIFHHLLPRITRSLYRMLQAIARHFSSMWGSWAPRI